MAECTKCKWVDGTLYDALESVVWYDGHYVWLKELRDNLSRLADGEVYHMPQDLRWNTEEHTIMMLLVGMFGDWGTSIRCGWIGDKAGCIAFIEQMCEDFWAKDGDNDGE